MTGIINVLKPPGMTSHDVVSFIRRLYKIKRVGHAGTLDPDAAGVLPIFLGSATRLIEYLENADKSYRAWMTLGYSTDTGDDSGAILSSITDFLPPNHTEVEKVLQSFLGITDQIPPMYSAIKMQGKKLYELAREGITVERKSRTITIHNIQLIALIKNKILFDVRCSKGTYIRTLCQDIGDKLEIPSVMSFLVRTQVGPFHLSTTKTLEEIAESPYDALLSTELAVMHLPQLFCSETEERLLRQGQSIPSPALHYTSPIRLQSSLSQTLFGIGRYTETEECGVIHPAKILPDQ